MGIASGFPASAYHPLMRTWRRSCCVLGWWGCSGCGGRALTLSRGGLVGLAWKELGQVVLDTALLAFRSTSGRYRQPGAGFAKLGDWLEGLGVEIVRFGVEGSGGLGVHLAVYLVAAGFDVREVPGLRTDQLRRQLRRPKTDHEDSVSLALATLVDPNLGPARAAMRVSAETEELAVIVAERRSLTRRRVQLLNEAGRHDQSAARSVTGRDRAEQDEDDRSHQGARRDRP